MGGTSSSYRTSSCHWTFAAAMKEDQDTLAGTRLRSRFIQVVQTTLRSLSYSTITALVAMSLSEFVQAEPPEQEAAQ